MKVLHTGAFRDGWAKFQTSQQFSCTARLSFSIKPVKCWSQISRSHCLVDWYWLCMSLKPSTIIPLVSESMRVMYSMKRATTKVPKTRPWSSGMWPQSWPLSRGHIITCLRVICASVIHVAKYLRLRQTSGVCKGERLQGVGSTQVQKVPIFLLNHWLGLKTGDYLRGRNWLNTQKNVYLKSPTAIYPLWDKTYNLHCRIIKKWHK